MSFTQESKMLRYKFLLWIAPLPLLAIQTVAANVQVGGCKPHLQSFATISAAVSSVSPGSTIQVCPGTYAEQVTITQPLNLQGITSGTANQVLITVPSGGLLPNATSMFGESVAAQVLVQGAGPVNITNLTVDGTGGDLGCASNTWIAGIFYGSSSSGNINRVRASNQTDAGCAVGIWAENGDSSNPSITVQNSTVYNADDVGIFAGSADPPSLSVNLQGNSVNASSAPAGILVENVNGQVRANNVINALIGVFDTAPGVSVAGNTIGSVSYGIFLLSGGSAVNNDISNSGIGIALDADGATVRNNRILSSADVGVELSCLTATLSGNFINDAPVGLDQVSSSTVIGSNTFANTATTITSSCGTAAAFSPALRASSREQWHTPATPFGTRRK